MEAPAAPFVLGVDVGGTKIGIGLVSADGQQLGIDRIATHAAQDPLPTLQRVVHAAENLLEQRGLKISDLSGVGIACAGLLDIAAGRIVQPVNLPTWINLPIVNLLSDMLGCPGFLENDGNAAAVGEHHFGAGRGVANMVYLTISTGIGGGVVLDNRSYQGENGNAMEIGHMTVMWNGRKCVCGNLGCWEAYASGTGLANRAREALLGGTDSMLAPLNTSPKSITGETVVEAARQGDQLATELWDETLQILAAGMVSVINIFNPKRIVIGGGLANARDMLFPPLRAAIAKRAMPALLNVVEIVPAELAGAAGILGAAGVAVNHLSFTRRR